MYIGYLDRAPKKLAKSIVVISTSLLLVSWVVGVALVRSQNPFAEGTFEFGTVRSYTGWMETGALPTLTVFTDDDEVEAKYVLVSEGKHGAAPGLVSAVTTSPVSAAYDNESPDPSFVRLQGTLIYRDDVRMLEITGGSIEPVLGSVPPLQRQIEFLGAVTLRGEIVDSKCFLGVMKPGEKTVHRACARLCIRGGIPPMLVIRQENGSTEKIFLVDQEGGAVNIEVLPFVATPVSVSGSLYDQGGLKVLRIDTASLRLLD